MAIHKTAGSKYFIGPVVNPDSIEAMTTEAAIAFFDAIVDWEEVEEVEDLGELGDTSEEVTFTALGNRRVRKMKGSRNAGSMAVVVGRDPLDAGQQAMVAAEKTDFNYAFKILYADARTENHSNSIEYYAGAVISRPTNLGNVSNVTRRTFNVGVNTAIYEKPSASLVAPTNVLLPSIAGLAVEGGTLTAIEGQWTADPAFTYQWQQDAGAGFVNIGGATGRTYVPVAGNVGNPLRVVVTGTNPTGDVSVNSAPTVDVVAA